MFGAGRFYLVLGRRVSELPSTGPRCESISGPLPQVRDGVMSECCNVVPSFVGFVCELTGDNVLSLERMNVRGMYVA